MKVWEPPKMGNCRSFSLSCWSTALIIGLFQSAYVQVGRSQQWFYVFTCQVLEHKNDSKLGKEYIKAVYWHPAHLTVPHTKCWAGWITNWNQDTRRNISDLRYADDTTLMTESEEELKSLLMKVKEDSEKADLKQHSKSKDHGIQSHHFIANRWWKNENSDRLYFLGLQNHCGCWLQTQN